MSFLMERLREVQRENAELHKKHEDALKLMGLVMTQPTDISVALANAEKEKWVQCDQLEEMRRDKERLDWILSGAGRFWLSSREDIDQAMERCIFDDLSDKQRQQICHEHGQPSE